MKFLSYFHRAAQRSAGSRFFWMTASGMLSMLWLVGSAQAQFSAWKHSGSIFILTTPAGAHFPATSVVKDFPLLVHLHGDSFPFSTAAPDGRDIRFSSEDKPLSFEIDEWDQAAERASIWVRIPTIRGNSRQELTLHWGNPNAPPASQSRSVFNLSNGYLSVWHLGNRVDDVVGNIDSQDQGTTPTPGIIGTARHFPGQKGIFCGENIQVLPAGASSHSTQAWFRSDVSNGRIVSWGNEKGQGKVQMWYRSPPQIRMDCYFSNGDVRGKIPGRSRDWTHVVHTFAEDQSLLYINGQKQGAGNPAHSQLQIERPARMWIGGWYNHYDYIGDMDEVRISTVARSADWIRLEYENQKPLQTLVGPLVQRGTTFSVTPKNVTLNENQTMQFSAQAGGAENVSWRVIEDDKSTLIGSNRFHVALDAGRVQGSRKLKVRFSAVFQGKVKSIDIPVTIQETLPEPEFRLRGPANWDGRETIEIRPEISNLAALQRAGVDQLDYRWKVSGLAGVTEEAPGKLVLSRSQNSGQMKVSLALSNGGEPITASTDITVKEPTQDPWVTRTAGETEMPMNGQFYARDEKGQGTLHCRGQLQVAAKRVFLRVFADDKLYAEERQDVTEDNRYAFAIRLQPALVNYRVEFGTTQGDTNKVLYSAGDIVCGDAYLIQGQSNALATDTREESPRVTNPWVRSYGRPRFFREGERENLWCKPTWKAGRDEFAELGWWGMELAKQLVESQQVPIFILNAAQGGTRIDQHQRNDRDPTDVNTIYGRMLWRLKAARLTHGIRAIIWHQGENDQGAAGPDGGYGWETYQDYFVAMSADWKRDFPNVSRYYLFQIWPNACSMGRDGNGDMLREKQRTLPRLYSNMKIISTLGIQPGGGCHYPLAGWNEFAKRMHGLLARDFYGQGGDQPLTAPNLLSVSFVDDRRRVIELEFDQPIVWQEQLASEFYFDNTNNLVASGAVQDRTLRLQLKDATSAQRITYLKESSWNPQNLLRGANGMAALTFCNVLISPPDEDPR